MLKLDGVFRNGIQIIQAIYHKKIIFIYKKNKNRKSGRETLCLYMLCNTRLYTFKHSLCVCVCLHKLLMNCVVRIRINFNYFLFFNPSLENIQQQKKRVSSYNVHFSSTEGVWYENTSIYLIAVNSCFTRKYFNLGSYWHRHIIVR